MPKPLTSVRPNHRPNHRPNPPPHQTAKTNHPRPTTQDQPPKTIHPRQPPIIQPLHRTICHPSHLPFIHPPQAQKRRIFLVLLVLNISQSCFIAHPEYTALPTSFSILLTNLSHQPDTTVDIPKRVSDVGSRCTSHILFDFCTVSACSEWAKQRADDVEVKDWVKGTQDSGSKEAAMLLYSWNKEEVLEMSMVGERVHKERGHDQVLLFQSPSLQQATHLDTDGNAQRLDGSSTGFQVPTF